MAATQVTEVYDAVLTSTARYMNGEIRDQITRSNRIVAWLVAHGRYKSVNGGERIKVDLMYEQNQGADIYNGYGQLDTTPTDGITAAFAPWSQMAVPITISGKEERQNMGDKAIHNLLQTKVNQSKSSAIELQNNCLVAGKLSATGNLNAFTPRAGKLDTSALGPSPLPVVIDADADRSVAFQEINGATETWWQNQSLASSATSFVEFKQELNKIYNNCSRGINGAPDLAFCDQSTWEMYFSSLASLERYYITNQRVINILGGAEDEMLKFRRAVMLWDEVVPDVGTSTASPLDGGVGSYLASGSNGTIFFINREALEYCYHPSANWTQTPFVRPANQDARVAHLLWMGQVTCNNRRKLGVLYDVDNSLSS